MDNQNYSPTTGVPTVSNQPLHPTLTPPPKPKSQLGHIIVLVLALLVAATAIGLLVYVYVQWQDSTTAVQSQIDIAVAEAKEEERSAQIIACAEEAKRPNLPFTGPEDYGRLSFEYPRTWSVHVAKDATKGGDFEAYFNPGFVGPISSDNRFAIRLVIRNKRYEDVLKDYESSIKSGKLTHTVFQTDKITSGARLDGEFSKDINGSAVLFSIPGSPMTVLIRTDTPEATRNDFEALIKTIQFN